jgi:hypothetical protein
MVAAALLTVGYNSETEEVVRKPEGCRRVVTVLENRTEKPAGSGG